MTIRRLCKFHRDKGSIHDGQSTGYCDLDCEQTICDGEIDFCGKTDSLKRYLFAQMKKEGGLEWERKRNVLFSENQKV